MCKKFVLVLLILNSIIFNYNKKNVVSDMGKTIFYWEKEDKANVNFYALK